MGSDDHLYAGVYCISIADNVVDHKQRRSVRVVGKTSWISPYISDLYGCLSLVCHSGGSFLYVYIKNIAEEEEKLLTYYVIRNKDWVHVDNIRLKSFTRGPYQVNILTL